MHESQILFFRSRGLSRRHSRASSVDRREIFTKYIARGNEHSDNIHPYENDDPELRCQPVMLDLKKETNDKIISTLIVPREANKIRQSLKQDFFLVRLRWDQFDNEVGKTLGIFIALMKEVLLSDKQGFSAFFIAYIRKDGLVWR